LADLRLHYIWNPHLKTIEPETIVRRDTTYRTTNTILGRQISVSNTISKLSPPHEMELTCSQGPLQYVVNYQLEKTAHGTSLSCSCDVRSDKRVFKYAAPAMENLARNRVQSDLETLKLIVENEKN
jgi:hypothetical protein